MMSSASMKHSQGLVEVPTATFLAFPAPVAWWCGETVMEDEEDLMCMLPPGPTVVEGEAEEGDALVFLRPSGSTVAEDEDGGILVFCLPSGSTGPTYSTRSTATDDEEENVWMFLPSTG